MSITAVKIVTPASLTPITLADAKGQLRVTHSAEDAHIQNLIKAATNWAQTETRRFLLSTDVRLNMDRFPYGNQCAAWDEIEYRYWNMDCGTHRRFIDRHAGILLPGGKVTAISKIEYIDPDGVTQTLTGPTSTPAGTDYQEDFDDDEAAWVFPPSNLFWPDVATDRLNAVSIFYTAGFGTNPEDVPDEIRHALRLRVSDYFNMRDSEALEKATAAERLISPFRILAY